MLIALTVFSIAFALIAYYAIMSRFDDIEDKIDDDKKK